MSEGMTAEELYSVLEESARLVAAPFSREKVWPVLSAYREGFGDSGVIFSLQAGEQVAELEYTVQVSPGIDDPYGCAVANGLAEKTGHPVGTLLAELQALVPGSEYYIDCGIAGGFKKIYANFPHSPQKLARLAELPSMPGAVAANAEFYARHGLEDVVLIGVDYKNRTMNLYFQLPPGTAGNLEPETVRSMLRETRMHEPSEKMLAYAARSYRVYTTHSWESEDVHRISFGPRPRRDMDLSSLPARLEPRLEEFMRATPHDYPGDLINASAAKWSHTAEFLDLAAYYRISPMHLRALIAAGEAEG